MKFTEFKYGAANNAIACTPTANQYININMELHKSLSKLLKLTECKRPTDGQPPQYSFARCKNNIRRVSVKPTKNGSQDFTDIQQERERG